MKALSKTDNSRLDELFNFFQDQYQTLVGYPCSAQFDYTSLYRFLKYPVNNVGDPYVSSTYRINTKPFEQEVLQWFMELTHAEPDNTWGYVTNGGTEGNLYGFYLARELMPNGMVYYSDQTHYSVSKNLRMLKMSSIMIRSLANGEIDYDDLYETIRIHRELPPIILANIGTTMKAAVDNIMRIRQILKDMSIPQFYIHCDAALDGMILPFVPDPPEWDFQAGIDSLSISGHKFIGSPIPCGIVLANKANVDRVARFIEYIGTLDTTVTGSRNGITPLILWYAIRGIGRKGFAEMVRKCIETADYAIEVFASIGLRAWRNPNGVTVVFPRPPAQIVDKWQIAVQDNYAHIITMQHITKQHIDELIADIKSSLEKEKIE